MKIQEIRRNPEQNPRIDPKDVLEDYQGMPNIYVTFHEIPYIGINPMPGYDTTPIGIYSYPLSYVLGNVRIKGRIQGSVPFASDYSYMSIFEQLGNTWYVSNPSENRKVKQKFIDYAVDELLELDQSDFAYDVAMNVNSVEGKSKDEIALEYIDMIDYRNEHPWDLIYEYVRLIHNGSLAKWTRILLDLGYDAADDSDGEGIIHRSEPIQAVHFDKSSIEIFETILK